MKQLFNNLLARVLVQFNPTTASVLKQFDKTISKLDDVATFQKAKAKQHTDTAAKLQQVVAQQVTLSNKALIEAEAATQAAARIEKLLRG